MNKILVEVSVGELLDKITILEIKKEKIKDNESLKFINDEYNILKYEFDKNIKFDEKLKKLFNSSNSVSKLSIVSSRNLTIFSVVLILVLDMSGFAKSEPTTKRSFWILINTSLILGSISRAIAIPNVEFSSSIAPYDIILSCDFQTLELSNNEVLPSSPVFV